MTLTTVDGAHPAPLRPATPIPTADSRTPSALLRLAATALPRALIARLAGIMVRSLGGSHPKLLRDLEHAAPARIHVLPTDLPYGFALDIGRMPLALTVIERDAGGSDAAVAASVATLIDLLEGRIDGDTLFFRRDLSIAGSTAAIVELRNVLDREEIALSAELARPLGRFGRPARGLARRLDRLVERAGARVAALHRTLHPSQDAGRDTADLLDQCRTEIAALTSRLGKLEARQKRRDEARA
ncbi:MAG: SCP2 sterol-binding domain-containing protein [Gammaproteobacteria bacterium]|nr:SCP2 sterol-binding domain-containing protein [Gammaproteobacteria bacterium]MDE2348021.1 SCP2 sterol-binding domain-containing protein [Gammaproteobacteria bacterium]